MAFNAVHDIGSGVGKPAKDSKNTSSVVNPLLGVVGLRF